MMYSRASWWSPLATAIALVIPTVGWLQATVNSLVILSIQQGVIISFEFSEKINKNGGQMIKLFTLANTENGILDIGINQTCN